MGGVNSLDSVVGSWVVSLYCFEGIFREEAEGSSIESSSVL